jgi:hypothetical protein
MTLLGEVAVADRGGDADRLVSTVVGNPVPRPSWHGTDMRRGKRANPQRCSFSAVMAWLGAVFID